MEEHDFSDDRLVHFLFVRSLQMPATLPNRWINRVALRVSESQNLFRALVKIRMDFWGGAKPIFRSKLRNFSKMNFRFLNTFHASRSVRSQQERQRHKRNNQEITWNTKHNLFDRMLCYGISGYPFLVPRLRLPNSQFTHCKSRNARNEAGGEARRGEAWISAGGI